MKPGHSTIAEIRNGGLSDDIAEAIKEVTDAVRETGRAGEIIIKLKVKPYDGEAGEIERLSIADLVTTKKPLIKQRETTFFITAGKEWTRQHTIPGVDAPARPAAAADGGPAIDGKSRAAG